jgi:hypothetical protein
MLIKLILAYVLVFGESFKVFGVNWAVIMIFIAIFKQFISQSRAYIFIIFVISLYAFFSFLNNNYYYVSQDLFIFLVLILGFFIDFSIIWLRRLIRFSILVLFLKTLYLFFFPANLIWGGGNFLDGNIFDFGIYKRIQIKGGDAILMAFPLFFKINKINIFNILFVILLVFAGSRALFGYVLMILFLTNFHSVFSFIRAGIITIVVSLLIFNVLGFGERLIEDNGRGEEWRFLEGAIVLNEVKQSIFLGNGLGSGFIMPIASGSTFEDGINLYTHNILTWIMLKGGLFFLIFYFYINIKILRNITFSHKINILALFLLNIVNNYIATFTGALLFSIYLNYLKSYEKN